MTCDSLYEIPCTQIIEATVHIGKRTLMGKEKTEGEKERKRENASRIYINSLLLRASHISDILAQRVVSSQNFKETFSTMIRIKLSRVSDKLLLVTNDACYR